MRLAFVGDVMLGRQVGRAIAVRPPASFWTDVVEVLKQADLVVANLECAITTKRDAWPGKVFHFGAPPQAVDVLRAAGVGLVSLANNHVLDFGREGLLDTIRYLDAAKIAHAGAGAERCAAAHPVVVKAGSRRVGFIAFTDNMPEWRAGDAAPGTNFLDFRSDERTLEVIARAAQQARGEGAGYVVLSVHWGPNMVQRPSHAFRQFAHAVVERGVDLLYGHSAHVFQGIEVHQGRPILYDTGDFLDDYAVDPALRNDQSFVVLVDVDDAVTRTLRLVPVQLGYAVVGRARGRNAADMCDRMVRLSAELGTSLERTASGLTLETFAGSSAQTGAVS